MRVVGKRPAQVVGLRGPTEAEIAASVDASRRAPRVVPKGVYRYRSHAEADAAMERWTAEAMARRARELDP